MTAEVVRPEVFASILASRLLHDVSGPLSGLVSGLELLAGDDDPAMKRAGLELASASAAALTDWLDFSRLAFAGEATPRGGSELARLAAQPFTGRRARLVWEAGDGPFSGLAARILLLGAQIAAASLGRGGLVRVIARTESRALLLSIEAEGPKIVVSDETLAGLKGQGAPSGLAGRWAPARLVRELIEQQDGQLDWSIGEERFLITARLRQGAASAP